MGPTKTGFLAGNVQRVCVIGVRKLYFVMSLSTKHLFIPPHTPLVYCFFHMAADDEDESAEPRSIVPVMAPGPPPGIEKSTPSPLPAAVPADEGSAVVRSVVRRWRREHLLEKSGLILRALAWIFSLIAVAVLASNRRGGWMSFDHYQEYRYLLAVAVVALVYSTAQVLRQAHRLGTGKDLAPKQYSGIVDFAGDQVIAYLLISASSAAIPITDRMRQEVVNTFTDASVAAISMALLTFAALCLSALISGFLVSKRIGPENDKYVTHWRTRLGSGCGFSGHITVTIASIQETASNPILNNRANWVSIRLD
ncbi:unnamed protein product [Musa hybrid cultivar]